MMRNMFPKCNSIAGVSPWEIFAGFRVDYKRDCKLGFGEYVQVYAENNITNTMEDRTLGAQLRISRKYAGNVTIPQPNVLENNSSQILDRSPYAGSRSPSDRSEATREISIQANIQHQLIPSNLSIPKAIRLYGVEADASIMKEIGQLQDKGVWTPIKYENIQQIKNHWKSFVPIKKKRYHTKAQTGSRWAHARQEYKSR